MKAAGSKKNYEELKIAYEELYQAQETLQEAFMAESKFMLDWLMLILIYTYRIVYDLLL